MHFWIDKRSQAYTFNGRHGVPPSLASGRRNKSITPLHRLHSLENISIPQIRRPIQQHSSPSRMTSHQTTRTQAPVVSQEPPSEPTVEIRRNTEVDPSTRVDVPAVQRAREDVSHAQLMKLGGLTKYGMWVSFGLTALSIAASRIYSDYKGTFEIFLLCTLGLITGGLFIACILVICKTKPPPHLVNIHPVPPQAPAAEIEIPDVMNHRDIVISTIATSGPTENVEDQPPPPYDVAVLLPAKNLECAEFPPPPTYENATR